MPDSRRNTTKRKTNLRIVGGRAVKTKKKGFVYAIKRIAKDISRIDFVSRITKNKPIKLAIGASVLIILFLIVLWAFTNKNAYDVFLDDTKIGTVQMNDKLQATDILNTAISKLEGELQAKVMIAQKVNLKPVHESKKSMVALDYIVSEIRKKLVYRVEAVQITINGLDMAVVKNEKEADSIINGIISTYVKEGSTVIESGVQDEKVYTKNFFKPTEIETYEKAYATLTTTQESEQIYRVKSGDSLSKIATTVAMSIDDILEINKDMNVNTVLNIGKEIKVIVKKPLLSVKTVEELKVKEPVVIPVKTVENPGQYKTYKKVISEGKAGESEITIHITKINGVETERKEFSRKDIVAPVEQVVEIGTGNVVKRR